MAALHSIKAKLISLATGLFICSQAVFASVQTVAVLPSEGVLDANELEYLTSKAQEVAVRVLPRGSFEVFPRDVIIRRLGGVDNYLKECREAACIVDLGKKAQVDYVSQCSFGKLGSDLTVTFELYNVSTSGLVDKFGERAKDIDGLLDIIDKRISESFMKIPGASPEAKIALPSEPSPPPPPKSELFVVPAAVLEPEPLAAVESKDEEAEDKEGGKVFSLGLRIGFNFSHFYATYENSYANASGTYKSTPGFQLGLVFDWALSDWFHIQPGVVYIQKGTEDEMGDITTLHCIEVPLLLSFKVSALRLNAGPYLNVEGSDTDIGLSAGFGFDIDMFYMGMFYDYGFMESYSYEDSRNGRLKAYNRTLGFNLGVNL